MALARPQVQPTVGSAPQVSTWPAMQNAFAGIYKLLQGLALYLQSYLTSVYYAITNSSQSGVLASRPAFGNLGYTYYATDTSQLFYDTGTAWITIQTA